MGGGDLNMKKTFHPLTYQNQERIWKAEQRAAAEQKKKEEHLKTLREEKQIEELRRVQVEAGLATRKDRLDWMYEGGVKSATAEDFLLGKPVEEKDSNELKKLEQVPGSLMLKESSSSLPSSKDQLAKMKDDPLVMIKHKEMEMKKQLLKNPLNKARILHQLEEEMKQDKHNQHKSKHHKHKDHKDHKDKNHKDKDHKHKDKHHKDKDREHNDNDHKDHSSGSNNNANNNINKDHNDRNNRGDRDSHRNEDRDRNGDRDRARDHNDRDRDRDHNDRDNKNRDRSRDYDHDRHSSNDSSKRKHEDDHDDRNGDSKRKRSSRWDDLATTTTTTANTSTSPTTVTSTPASQIIPNTAEALRQAALAAVARRGGPPPSSSSSARRGTSKGMSEEERLQRLQAMESNAQTHQAIRDQRLVKYSSEDNKSGEEKANAKFLSDLNQQTYMQSDDRMEDRLKRNAYTRQSKHDQSFLSRT
eukprot:c11020_g1_i1.p1 GENE.c11020_g1_i1~~c11020_g1_i1.p1  ORF type:complete len:498 (-),score=152.12 c11020_g1_i1:105-1520(-)